MPRQSKEQLAAQITAEATKQAVALVAEAAAKATLLAADAAALATKSAPEIMTVASKLQTHEEVCAQRYENLEVALKDLKDGAAAMGKAMWTANGMLVLTLLATVGFFFAKGWK